MFWAGYVLALAAEVQNLKHKLSALEGELASSPGPLETSSGDAKLHPSALEGELASLLGPPELHPSAPTFTETGEGPWVAVSQTVCPNEVKMTPTGSLPNAGEPWGSRSRSLAPASCR